MVLATLRKYSLVSCACLDFSVNLFVGFANNNTSISVARWGLVCVSANSDLATVATSGVASLVFDDLAPGISADSFSTFGKVQELFSISLAACAVLNGSLVRMMLDERLLESIWLAVSDEVGFLKSTKSCRRQSTTSCSVTPSINCIA